AESAPPRTSSQKLLITTSRSSERCGTLKSLLKAASITPRTKVTTMVIAVLERVPVGLRGDLTRWLLEVRAGVFVGTCSGVVRERLWRHIEREVGDEGGAVLVHTADNEQGFTVDVVGDPSYHIEDFEGLQ